MSTGPSEAKGLSCVPLVTIFFSGHREHTRVPGMGDPAMGPRGPRSARGGGRMWSCSPGGRRALTADHAPAQLPDALLTGFFPLKVTQSLSAQGGGCWHLAEVPDYHTLRGGHIPGHQASR